MEGLSELLHVLGYAQCTTCDLGPRAHMRATVVGRVVHYRSPNPYRPGIARVLTAIGEATVHYDTLPRWLAIYQSTRWATQMAKTLGVRLPSDYYEHRRALARTAMTGRAVSARHPRAYRWAHPTGVAQ
jgi:hypothetical protein